MDKKSLIIAAIAVLVLNIAINVSINRYMLNKQIDLIVETVKIPAIMTVDMDALVTRLTEDGHSSVEVLAYVDNINKAMQHRNVLLLDRKSAISVPNGYKLEHVSPAALIAYLRDQNVEPSKPDDFRRNIQEASKLFDYPTAQQ